MTQQTQQDQSPDSLTLGYEPGGMRARWFAVAVVGFIGFAAVMHVLLWYLVKADANPRPAVDYPASNVAGDYHPPNQAPPLQLTPRHDRVDKEDLQAMYRGEDKVFVALGWHVDERTHRVTLPPELIRRVADRPHPPRMARQSGAVTTTRIVTPIPGVDQGGTR